MVKSAHRVLNCHHYSLYDLRIDADEQPYILEAALFCSFSPLSVIPAMAQHAGREDLKHPQLFHGFLERAIKEKKMRPQKPAQVGCIERDDTMDTLEGLDGVESYSSQDEKSSAIS
jgi:hypothetical protein